jgi:O-antigen/teichoic acid export membrane protein
MKYGWKVLAADFSGTFFDRLRSLIVGKFYTTADLAYYERGRSLSTFTTDNISTAMISVLFPAFSNCGEAVGEIKALLRKANKTMSFVIFPATIGLAIVAAPLVKVLLTDKWMECVPFIQILGLSSCISLLGNMGLQVMKAVGRSDILLRIEFIKKPVFVALLIIGAKISVLAVALTMLIYSVYATLINGGTLKKLIDYSLKEMLIDIAPAALLTGIMAVCTLSLKLTSLSGMVLLVMQVVVGIAAYIAFSFLSKNESFIYLAGKAKTLLKK